MVAELKKHFCLSLVIPVYNEELVLPELIKRLESQLKDLPDYEIIFVDDASNDSTKKLIKKFQQTDSKIKLVELERNQGQQRAFEAGLAQVKGDCVITMDADMQDPPELIKKLLDQWTQGFHIVATQRFSRSNSRLRSFLYDFYYSFVRFLGAKNVILKSGDYCLYDKSVLRELLQKVPYPKVFRFFRYQVAAQKKLEISIVGFEEPPRFAGTTKYSWLKLLKLGLHGIENLGLMRRLLFVHFFLISPSVILAHFKIHIPFEFTSVLNGLGDLFFLSLLFLIFYYCDRFKDRLLKRSVNRSTRMGESA